MISEPGAKTLAWPRGRRCGSAGEEAGIGRLLENKCKNCYENIFISVFLTKSIIVEGRAAEYSARPQQKCHFC